MGTVEKKKTGGQEMETAPKKKIVMPDTLIIEWE